MAFSNWGVFSSEFSGCTIAQGAPSYVFPGYSNSIFGIVGLHKETSDGPTISTLLTGSSNTMCLGFNNAGNPATANVYTSALSYGFYAGTISTRLQIFAGGSLLGACDCGILVLQDQLDMRAAGSGIAYGVMLDTLLFENRLRLVKFIGGTDAYIQLGQTSTAMFVCNVFYDLTLSWLRDPSFLKGTQLTATFNGSTIFDLVHTGSDAIVSTVQVAEGLYAHATTNQVAFLFSSTTITRTDLATVNAVSYPPV